tara:strand:+ start:119 stop:373 length:255 start_codon:yes stop_codon:yes gene_type:complete
MNTHALRVDTKKGWRCPSGRTFFGLNDKYMESVYEQFFALKHFGGWSFIEMYNLPIGLRNWFTERLQRQFKEEKKQMDKAMRKR